MERLVLMTADLDGSQAGWKNEPLWLFRGPTIFLQRQTRRERLRSALYLRLKKCKFLKFAQDVFMKSSKNSFKTPKGCLSCSLSFGNHFSPNWKHKNFEKIRFSFGKCRIVPKTLRSPLCSETFRLS